MKQVRVNSSNSLRAVHIRQPDLEELTFAGPLSFVDTEGNNISWLELLSGKPLEWEAVTEALRHWWEEERPLTLRLLKVESKLDLCVIPKLFQRQPGPRVAGDAVVRVC